MCYILYILDGKINGNLYNVISINYNNILKNKNKN